jgi:hypothetical protein
MIPSGFANYNLPICPVLKTTRQFAIIYLIVLGIGGKKGIHGCRKPTQS